MDALDNPADVLFHEEQRFRQFWLWILLLSVSVICTIAVTVAMFELAKRYGGIFAVTGEDRWAFLGFLVGFTGALGVPLLFYFLRLTTTVRPDGLFIQFFLPHLHPRRISLDNVVSVKAVTYHPIAQYGGWGIRYTWKGKAYNVSGNRGVRIDYSNGRHLLIGSQRPEELASAIRRILPAAAL